MDKISRVDAFSKIQEAIENGENHRANQMIKIVESSIMADRKGKGYYSDIKLGRDEKEAFWPSKRIFIM